MPRSQIPVGRLLPSLQMTEAPFRTASCGADWTDWPLPLRPSAHREADADGEQGSAVARAVAGFARGVFDDLMISSPMDHRAGMATGSVSR